MADWHNACCSEQRLHVLAPELNSAPVFLSSCLFELGFPGPAVGLITGLKGLIGVRNGSDMRSAARRSAEH